MFPLFVLSWCHIDTIRYCSKKLITHLSFLLNIKHQKYSLFESFIFGVSFILIRITTVNTGH